MRFALEDDPTAVHNLAALVFNLDHRTVMNLRLTIFVFLFALALAGCIGELPNDLESDADTASDTDGTSDVTTDTPGDVPPQDTPGDTPGDTPADMPDMMPATATLSLFHGPDDPAEGIDVIFNAPDGSILNSGKTGADGSYTAEMVAGGSMTFDGVIVFGDSILITMYEINPGDVVTMTDPSGDNGESMLLGSPRVLFGQQPSWVSRFDLQTECNSIQLFANNPAGNLDIYSDCLEPDDTVLLMAYAMDANNNLAGHQFSPGHTVQSLTDTPFAPDQNRWHTNHTMDLTLNNLDALGSYDIRFEVEVGGRPRYYPNNDFDLDTTENRFVFPVPSDADPLFEGFQYTLSSRDSNGSSNSAYISRSPQLPDNPTLDVSALMLPEITNTSFDIVAGRGTLAWSFPPGETIDAFFAFAFYATPQGERQWVFVAPPTASSVVTPVLPPELAFKGVGGVSMAPGVMVGVVDGSWVAGYDGAKANFLSLLAEDAERTSAPEWFLRRAQSGDGF